MWNDYLISYYIKIDASFQINHRLAKYRLWLRENQVYIWKVIMKTMELWNVYLIGLIIYRHLCFSPDQPRATKAQPKMTPPALSNTKQFNRTTHVSPATERRWRLGTVNPRTQSSCRISRQLIPPHRYIINRLRLRNTRNVNVWSYDIDNILMSHVKNKKMPFLFWEVVRIWLVDLFSWLAI